MRPRVAVVGAGVAGISAAYHLRREASVTLFEADTRAGGHAHTVEVQDSGRTLGLDTAFIVFNEPHYPRLTQFFADLGVATQPHPGKFSFFDLDESTAYVSDDFDHTEEEVRAKYPEAFFGLWREATRFLAESPRDFVRKRTDVPLGEYLERNGYSESFRRGFIVLIATAAWSVPADRVWEMPASTIIAFFFAHGGEGLGGRTVPWRTVTGGSISYVRAALKEIEAAGGDVLLNTPVDSVRQHEDGVEIRTAAGPREFDQVVLATHADDSLRLLVNPTPRQRLLEAISYSPTRATLHTDAAVQPTPRDTWRSWNYGRSGEATWVNYYLNDLQEFTADRDYFLTLDSGVPIAPEKVVADLSYRHPVFTTQARRLQSDIYSINAGPTRVKFAGSYFHSRKMGPDILGMHESGFDSGMAAAEAVLASSDHR
ncbi:FAD-dependent oxidoreductase [Actinosynnema sp. NPDC020468]|uniref:NAD(P)/FAD-dependent oxidoreductase n=1 Tax=Actinosynnema sp. NPDC020468 TaxID=3154488 RepID=UPI0033DC304F